MTRSKQERIEDKEEMIIYYSTLPIVQVPFAFEVQKVTSIDELSDAIRDNQPEKIIADLHQKEREGEQKYSQELAEHIREKYVRTPEHPDFSNLTDQLAQRRYQLSIERKIVDIEIILTREEYDYITFKNQEIVEYIQSGGEDIVNLIESYMIESKKKIKPLGLYAAKLAQEKEIPCAVLHTLETVPRIFQELAQEYSARMKNVRQYDPLSQRSAS